MTENPAKNLPETLRYLSISRATLYRRMKAEKDPVPKPDFYVGEKPYWRLSTLETYLNGLQGRAI